ncbi:MAG: tRNA threonylcarbamoyladenosine dehydratase [Rikenellaceae bacterium]
MQNNNEWQERTRLMFGEQKMEQIACANILVVGVGGVGAYAAEMLVRAGVRRMTIVDSDHVNPTNINRQLVALHSTVGKSKVKVLGERLKDINPELELRCEELYLKDELTDWVLDSEKFDYLVDAIDTLSPKAALIRSALERKIPIVSSMGAGAKTDPTQIQVKDIGKSHHCPLAHMLRKRLHKMGIRTGFWAVFSPEPVREGAMVLEEDRNKKSMVGTVSYMPSVFGCVVASVVIRDLLGEM